MTNKLTLDRYQELFTKYQEARFGPSHYDIELTMSAGHFKLAASVTTRNIVSRIVIVEYTTFMEDDPDAEVKKLNDAIGWLSYFLRNGDHEPSRRQREEMFNDMKQSCKEQGKDSSWVAEYLNLDPEVMTHATA